MAKKVRLNYSSSSKDAVQIVDEDWEEPTEPVDFGPHQIKMEDVVRFNPPSKADFVGDVRELKDLPRAAEISNETGQWVYSGTQGKFVRRRKSHFNVGTRVGKLRITHIVETYPSFGELDYSNPEPLMYACRSYLCLCDPALGGCGREGIVRPYHYLYQRGERASCGEKSCAPLRMDNHNDEYKGKLYRRLKVLEWVQGKGWKCECQLCGEEEFVRYSWQLERMGSPKKCSNYELVKEPPKKKERPTRLTKSKLARMDGRTLRHLKH